MVSYVDKIPRWKISTVDPFNYVVHLRSFAPWESFGPYGHHGDGREFSTRENVTSRIRMEFLYSLKDRNVISQRTVSDPSIGQRVVLGIPTGSDTMTAHPHGFARRTKVENGSTEIHASYHGSLPLAKPAFDINVNAAYHFSEVPAVGAAKLGVKVRVTGDDFPFFETFIRDTKGQRLFLCTSRPKDAIGYGRRGGPVLALPGNFKRLMARADLAVSVDKQGAFTSVDDETVDLADRRTWPSHRDALKTISIDAWNQYFTTRQWL
jgi:hypothetical protein